MKLKIKPSQRVNKRYLLIQGARKDIEKAILDYIGILGWAKASPSFVKTSSEGKVILAINRKEINNVRAAFELCKEKIKVLRVSGTLRALLSSPR